MKKEIGVSICQSKQFGKFYQRTSVYYYNIKNLVAGSISVSWLSLSEEDAQSVIERLGLVKSDDEHFVNYNCKAHIRMMCIYQQLADKVKAREQKENLQPA